MFLSFSFADTNLVAVGQVKHYTPDQASGTTGHIIPDGWFVTVSDTLTGESRTAKWTDAQLHAVVSLAMGSGEEGFVNDDTVRDLYAVAEPVLAGWPNTLRPIP